MKWCTTLLIAMLVLGLAALGLAIPNADAQMETNLYSFGSSPNNGPEGEDPYAGLVQGSDGNFYGTTISGGTNFNGIVFRISPGGTYTTLYFFGSVPNDGRAPWAGLVQGAGGDFYGTTSGGGTSTNCSGGCGTVFRITPGGSLTNLHSFGGYPNDGAIPRGGLVQGSDGNFYGTAYGGGMYNSGTVFRISADGNYTNLYSFGSPSDGRNPYAGLALGSDGNFYGTTFAGGVTRDGTVFRISSSGSYTSLYSFVGSPNDGANPVAGLVQGSDGNFYGTTRLGGSGNDGIVFRITPGGSLTNLHSFSGYPNDGDLPYGRLIQGSDGNLYGTASDGGTINFGTVFRIGPDGSGYTTLYSFVGYLTGDGAFPVAGLVQGDDGNFYGTTSADGANGAGTVFKLTVPLNPPPFPINQITGVQLSGTNIVFNVVSIAGETYRLQFSGSMNPTNWIDVPDAAVTNSIGALLTVTNIGGVVGPQGFYRFAVTP